MVGFQRMPRERNSSGGRLVRPSMGELGNHWTESALDSDCSAWGLDDSTEMGTSKAVYY